MCVCVCFLQRTVIIINEIAAKRRCNVRSSSILLPLVPRILEKWFDMDITKEPEIKVILSTVLGV